MSFITEVMCKLIFTDVHMRNNYRPNRALVILHSACAQFLSGKIRTKFACPAVNFDRLMKAYVDSTHLNNSDKLSRIIYGADKYI